MQMEKDLTVVRGHMVRTPTKPKAYKAVLEHAGGPRTEHPVDSMQEGEALIRGKTPVPAPRNRSRDTPTRHKT
jgi:hypothetical protein